MKFTLLFKTPHVIDQLDVTEFITIPPGDEEYAYAKEDKRTELEKFLEQWINYGECIRIEFDTDKNTATVI